MCTWCIQGFPLIGNISVRHEAAMLRTGYMDCEEDKAREPPFHHSTRQYEVEIFSLAV